MASRPAGRWRSDRIGAVIGVVVVHALLGYAFIAGLGVSLPDQSAGDFLSLIVLDLRPEPPPEPPKPPKLRAAVEKGGGASAPKALSLPQAEAPVPLIVLPSPVVSPPAPTGGSSSGEGTGGVGKGAGEGMGAGTGAGTGDGFTGARQIRGRFRNSDFPRSAKGAGRLKIGVRYAVGPSGRVDQCEIIEPSGHSEVDAMTCRVIKDRYRFKPARDDQGVPITEVMEEDYWWTMD